jgi:ABC-2 type transport system permease protein
MNLRKIWLIARREYLFNFRRRSYLFTAFVLPLIIVVAMMLIIGLLTETMESTSSFKAVGIVDKAGVLSDSAGVPTVKLPELFRLEASEEQANTDLQSHTIDGYYVLPADYLRSGHIDVYNRANLALTEGVNNELTSTIKLALASRIGDPALAERIQDPLKALAVYKVGSTEKLDETSVMSVFIVPTIFGLLVFMSVTVTSQFLMSGMVEEKENRMMELFVTSTRPSEMLWGKLLGLGALGLTQIVVWALFGVAFASTRGANIGQTLANLQLTPGLLLMGLAYFILGYLLFGSVMSGIGALVNAEQEGRQLSGILGTVGVIPFMLSFSYLTDPNGTIPRVLSLFPFTAPVGMILRVSWAVVPPGEILLSLGIMALTVVGTIWLSARLFRLGMLNYGKRLGLRDVVRAIREGRQAIVSRAQRKEASL